MVTYAHVEDILLLVLLSRCRINTVIFMFKESCSILQIYKFKVIQQNLKIFN